MHSCRLGCWYDLVGILSLEYGFLFRLSRYRRGRLWGPWIVGWKIGGIPKTSHLSFRCRKYFVGLREGVRLAKALRSTLGVFFHSFCLNFTIAFLYLCLAFDVVVLKGVPQCRDVASFARFSALSLPQQWVSQNYKGRASPAAHLVYKLYSVSCASVHEANYMLWKDDWKLNLYLFQLHQTPHLILGRIGTGVFKWNIFADPFILICKTSILL